MLLNTDMINNVQTETFCNYAHKNDLCDIMCLLIAQWKCTVVTPCFSDLAPYNFVHFLKTWIKLKNNCPFLKISKTATITSMTLVVHPQTQTLVQGNKNFYSCCFPEFLYIDFFQMISVNIIKLEIKQCPDPWWWMTFPPCFSRHVSNTTRCVVMWML